MNGEDLRFLAERATTLDDRSAVRLEEVHDRITVARRRRTVSALAGAACLVVALVVGIQVVTGGRDNASPDPAPTPSPAPDQAATQPEVGTCWNVPPRLLVADYWFDDSARVPCTEPHTTETAQVLELSAPTIAQAKQEGGDLCRDYVLNYVGVDGQRWIPWGSVMYLPSKAQVADGASWLRCDVVFLADWDYDSRIRTVSVAAEGLADDPPEDLWACLDQPLSKDQPFVPCDRPHAYEATMTVAGFPPPVVEYPSAAELEAATQEQCRAAVPDAYADVEVTAWWDPPAVFRELGTVAGICFMYHADGTPMPPR